MSHLGQSTQPPPNRLSASSASSSQAHQLPPDLGWAPLPLICMSVSVATLCGHLGLVVRIRDLSRLYGRQLVTALGLHTTCAALRLAACALDRDDVPSQVVAPINAALHFLELASAVLCLASVLLLWLEERRHRQAQPLIRVRTWAPYCRCLAISLLVASPFLAVGTLGTLNTSLRIGGLQRNGTAAASLPHSWNGFAESVSHAGQLSYLSSSLAKVYRDKNCAAPHLALVRSLRPVAVSYAYLLTLPRLLLQGLQAAPLIRLASIFDSMSEERRLDSRPAMHRFRVFAKLALSNSIVELFALPALLLYHSCESVCLWHIHFMLQALQSIFLCISCLFSRPSIEILMDRFGAREDMKLESGLGLMAAVMHSRRTRNLRGAGLPPAGMGGRRRAALGSANARIRAKSPVLSAA